MKKYVLKKGILKCIYENKSNMKLEIYIKARWATQNNHNEGSIAVKGNQFIQA